MKLAAPAAPRFRQLASFCVVALLLAAPLAAFGQRPLTTLKVVFPPVLKIGGETEIEIRGANLDGADKLIFSEQGISASQKMGEPDEIDPSPLPVENKFIVKVPGNASPGLCEMRTVGRFGASNPRAVLLAEADVVISDGSNRELEKATDVQLGQVAAGKVNSGSRDCYAVELKQGQRLIAEAWARRLDSRLDAALVVFDDAGRELTRARGFPERDAVLDFEAPADGRYVIGIYDFLYRGGDEFAYALRIHDGPHVDAVYPPVAEAGSAAKITIYGRNLPGGKPADDARLDGKPLDAVETQINMPGGDAATQLQLFGVAQPHMGGQSSWLFPYKTGDRATPVPIYYAQAPVVLEQEPNNESTAAQQVTPPCEFVGRFQGDLDWVEFPAKKGDSFGIRVVSHRMGLPTDPVLIVQEITKNDQGEEVVRQLSRADDPSNRNDSIDDDFDTSTDDPSYRLNADKDAVYRVCVHDQFNNDDARATYRLIITPQQPDFRLLATPEFQHPKPNNNQAYLGNPMVRQGGATAIRLHLLPLGGFDEEVEVTVEGLPGGVKSDGAILGRGVSEASLVITADANAQAWVGPIRIIGRAKADGQDLTRDARAATMVWDANNRQQEEIWARISRDMVLSVIDSEKETALTEVGDGQVLETSKGAKLEIPVKVARHDGFNGQLKFQAVGLPNEIKPKDLNIGNGNDGKLEIELTNGNLQPGSYTFYLRSPTKHKYAPNPDAIKQLEERLKHLEEAAKRLKEEADKIEDGDKKKEAQQTAKRADDMRKKAEQDLNNAKKNNQPKDIDVAAITTALKLRVMETPVAVTLPEMVALKQGEKAELSIQVERKYGYEDAVEVQFQNPSGVSGVGGKNFNIEKGQADGKLEINANENATPGEHDAELLVRVRFNNVQIDEKIPYRLKVEEVKKAE